LSSVVLGVDIGTTATKVVAIDAEGVDYATASVAYPLDEPRSGEAVQDPDVILHAVLEAVREAVMGARDTGAEVAGLAFSSAMHTLIGLDGDDRPLTPSITWADSRAASQAERLRAGPDGLELHRRTGTPVHPMAPLPKLVWFREVEPRTFAAVRRWVGIKEYVIARLTGEWVTDISIASATGLLELSRLDWDEQALDLAGIERAQLPHLVQTTHVLAGLRQAAAEDLGLPAATPLVVGASDGPLANLGVGAVRPGVAACSIGTSGALRVMVDRPAVDPQGRVFCYALTDERWVVGGAINNGGVVLRWARDALAPDLPEPSEAALTELAAKAPVGSGGLIMLPYLLSERAPHWSSLERGAYIGLTRAHRREHLVRAALEGVCLQLALVLQSMKTAGIEVREMRATGGFARSTLWRQMLTDALAMDVDFPEEGEGSSFGAALLGMEALGMVESIDVASRVVHIQETRRPQPDAVATYQALLPVFSSLHDTLTPTFRSLRRLTATSGADAEAPYPLGLELTAAEHEAIARRGDASNSPRPG
jgi:gluconokinase